MKRIGVIGIIVQGDRSIVIDMQKIIGEYADIIIGRMGIPRPQENISAISLIVEGENEKISALTGKLGRLNGISVKSALTSVEIEDNKQ